MYQRDFFVQEYKINMKYNSRRCAIIIDNIIPKGPVMNMQPIRYTLSYYLALIENAEDHSRFEYLYERYKKQMFYSARNILNDDYLAEDAVHEAFCKIAKNMNKIEDETSERAKGLVMLITKQASIDIYRKRKLQFDAEVYESTDEDGESTNFIEECAPAIEMPELMDFNDSEIGRAMQALSDDGRHIFLLRHALGYKTTEIAELTGFSVAKVEKQLKRSRDKLQAILSDKQ